MQRFAVPEDGERVRAQTIADRLGQGDDGGSGNGRIDRVAALEHHAQACLCSQGVRSGHDVARKQRQAGAGVGELVVKVHVSPR